MDKSPDAFRTISEVAEWLGVQAHVLRFWESKFSQVKPVKRAGGRRYYRPADMKLLGGIKKLLHDDGLTIKGVQKILKQQGVAHVAALSRELGSANEDSKPDAGADSTVVELALRASRKPAPLENDEPTDEADQTANSDTVEILPGLAADAGARDEPEPAQDGSTNDAETPAKPEAASLSQASDTLDPPAESDIRVAPGLLAQVARIDRIEADQASAILPLARQLRRWLEQSDKKGAS